MKLVFNVCSPVTTLQRFSCFSLINQSAFRSVIFGGDDEVLAGRFRVNFFGKQKYKKAGCITRLYYLEWNCEGLVFKLAATYSCQAQQA